MFEFENILSEKALKVYSLMLSVSPSYLMEDVELSFMLDMGICETKRALKELMSYGYVICVNMLYTVNYDRLYLDIFKADEEGLLDEEEYFI